MNQPTWHRGATAREHARTVTRLYDALPDGTDVAVPLGVLRAALAGDWDRRDPAAAVVTADATAEAATGQPAAEPAAGTAGRCDQCGTRVRWVPYDEDGRRWNEGEPGRWVDQYGMTTANPAGLDSHRHRVGQW